MCLPHGLEEEQAWPFLLSEKLDCEYVNFAQEGADNFFIYHSFLENYKKINQDDIIIIGWSHPSRKSFVFDPNNPIHVTTAKTGLVYQTETKTLFRSVSTTHGWVWSAKPKNSTVEFYDSWFNNYYSEYEQRCNFEAYMDSVARKVPCQYLPFYFSKESVDQIIKQNDNFMSEFIVENKVALSKIDQHMNATGHRLWTDHLIEQIKI
jgi:hypothetical protein